MRDWLSDRLGRGRMITRQASVQTPLRLVLRTSNGRVSIKGVEGNLATVRAEVELKGHHRDDGARADEIVAEGIVFEGDWLSVESPAGARDSMNVHYEISVPLATIGRLVVVNGPVDVRGLDGPLEVKLSNGPLSVEDIGGAVEIELSNGPVHVQRCRGSLDVNVSNGPIAIQRIAGPVDVTVNNGPVAIEDAGAGIEANATNGPISYKGPVGGNFEMHSRRGGIVLELPSDSRFELDAEAGRGHVICEFDVKDAAAPSDVPLPRILLRSERGEIVVSESARVGVS
jgi:hypothetical protein